MPESAIQADERVELADWPRTNRKSRAPERLRVNASDYRGRIYLGLRTMYRIAEKHRNGPDDDGFRADQTRGVMVFETELDELLAAVEAARAMVHAQGRSTSADAWTPRTRADRAASPVPARHAPAAGGSSRPPAVPASVATDSADDEPF